MVSTVRSGPSLFAARYRASTVGLVLVITLVAFENLAVATALPTAVRELDGLAYYSWPFTAFLVTSVIAMVLAGERCDRYGPRGTLLLTLAVFAAGLVVAGTATTMLQFVLGRAVQGLGAGGNIVAVYVVIAEVYDERLRPRVFAMISAAWVLPALLGPPIAGLVTQHLTWRLVFGGLVPFVLVGLLLVWPTLRRLVPHAADAGAAPRRLGRWAVLAAVGMSCLQYAGQHISWPSLPLALAGIALLAPAVRRLLPPGTLRLQAGLPAVIGYRGLLNGAFFAVDAFIPLTLSQVHGYSPAMAGLPLTVAALGWSAASWWQGRHPDVPRHRLIRAGCGFVSVGTAASVLVTFADVPGWLAGPLWTVAGAGMGLATASISVLALGAAAEDERGAVGAALQICDVLSVASSIGLAGVLLAAVHPLAHAIRIVDLAYAGLALVGVAMAGRLRAAEPVAARP